MTRLRQVRTVRGERTSHCLEAVWVEQVPHRRGPARGAKKVDCRLAASTSSSDHQRMSSTPSS